MKGIRETYMEWINLFAPHILERGEEYCDEENVSLLTIEDNVIEASVQGSETYHVYIERDGEEIMDMECDCPYARKGYNCKHMAAVLYFIDAEKPKIDTNPFQRVKNRQNEVRMLVDKIPETEVRKMLSGYVYENEALFNKLKMQYDFKMDMHQMTELKNEIHEIVRKCAGRGGYIDWQQADDFTSDLNYFLHTKIPILLEHNCIMQAFELTNLVFYEVGNVDIDDSDGGTSIVASNCYDCWSEILSKSDSEQKAVMQEWFERHKNTNYVIDYMEEYMYEFYEQNFADRNEAIGVLEESKILDADYPEKK